MIITGGGFAKILVGHEVVNVVKVGGFCREVGVTLLLTM